MSWWRECRKSIVRCFHAAQKMYRSPGKTKGGDASASNLQPLFNSNYFPAIRLLSFCPKMYVFFAFTMTFGRMTRTRI